MAVFLAAMGAVAIVAAREAWTVVVGGGLVVGAVALWWRSPALGAGSGWARAPWRRVALAVAGIAALTLVAQAAGLLVRDDSESAGGGAARHFGRHLLPRLPGGAEYATTLADGTEVRAWRTGTSTLHLRVDTASRRCSGGHWREWWHMSDLPRVRIDHDGRFHGRGGTIEALRPARHAIGYVAEGVVTATALRGELRRTDAYTGHLDGTCRRVVTFTAPAASR